MRIERIAVTLAAGLLALLAQSASAAAVVERIEVEGPRVVHFHLSEPVVARAKGVPPRLPVKARIIVDFDGAVLGSGAQEPVPGTGVIMRVRPEQLRNRDMVRATIELTRPVGFTVESAGNTVTLRIQIADDPPPPAAEPGAPPAS